MPDWTVQTPVSGLRSTTSASTAGSGGGNGSTDYIRASSTLDDFYSPTWSTDFSSGSVSRSGGTLTLSKAGIWHVSFACRGQCDTTAGAAVGAVSYTIDGVGFGIALGSYKIVDSVSTYVGSGGMIAEVATSIDVSFDEAAVYSTYDSDVVANADAIHYMAAHWVGP